MSGGPALAAASRRDTEAERVLAGIGLAVLAVGCFTVLDTTTKLVVASVPVVMALWFRYAFQAIATTLWVLPRHGLSVLRTRQPGFHLLRGMLLMVTSALAFFSLQFIPIAEFTSIVLLSPLMITLLAGTLLGESVSRLRWALVMGAFAGTLVILRPGGDAFGWTMLLPLALAVTNALFQLLTSKLSQTENPLALQFYTGWTGTLIISCALPFFWQALPSAMLWGQLAFMGLMGTVGHLFLILASQRAPASTLTPYFYVQIGFAMVAGWLVFERVPDAVSLAGIAMIAVCGAAGAWLTVRERRVPVEPAES